MNELQRFLRDSTLPPSNFMEGTELKQQPRQNSAAATTTATMVEDGGEIGQNGISKRLAFINCINRQIGFAMMVLLVIISSMEIFNVFSAHFNLNTIMHMLSHDNYTIVENKHKE